MAAAVAGVLASRWLPLTDPLSWASIIIRSVMVCSSYVLAHELLTRGSMIAEFNRVLEREASNFPPKSLSGLGRK
jgi:hypothetical protein